MGWSKVRNQAKIGPALTLPDQAGQIRRIEHDQVDPSSVACHTKSSCRPATVGDFWEIHQSVPWLANTAAVLDSFTKI